MKKKKKKKLWIYIERHTDDIIGNVFGYGLDVFSDNNSPGVVRKGVSYGFTPASSSSPSSAATGSLHGSCELEPVQ